MVLLMDMIIRDMHCLTNWELTVRIILGRDIDGADHKCLRVREACQGQAAEDGVRLLRIRSRRSVDSQGE
uniref:(S)-2-hydroxy-acid oxidase, peroxisomal, putative / glycolate oxidase, putative / short chain alpha-hydroxy acid oxidase, putative n=1 Tax=Arundo donax TaxID=35708 RepID=A0A0A9G0W3_ARUDO